MEELAANRILSLFAFVIIRLIKNLYSLQIRKHQIFILFTTVGFNFTCTSLQRVLMTARWRHCFAVVAKGRNSPNNGDSSSLCYSAYGGTANFESLSAFGALRKGGVIVLVEWLNFRLQGERRLLPLVVGQTVIFHFDAFVSGYAKIPFHRFYEKFFVFWTLIAMPPPRC